MFAYAVALVSMRGESLRCNHTFARRNCDWGTVVVHRPARIPAPTTQSQHRKH